ncbi:MAG: glycosyltransferase [Bacteroidales bacterium]|nr:glycosyltransferase [Bacteroidales bacterium]MCM1146229.1 glycosyltransferase [Bacteroidales bacterium]MCM1205333.1 glycosyltransferase [Bacillota bacterium]MCM1509580.1 glycosyltransferase [Clostridium sp.]
MKIIEIIPSLRSGGGERLVVDLCNELAKSNDVTLVTLWDDQLTDFGFYRQELSAKVHYINMKLDERCRLQVLWKIVECIRQVKPDVVHLHMCHMFAILAILLLGRMYKFYLTIHNDIKTVYAATKIKIIFNVLGRLKLLRYVTISQTNYNDFNLIYPKLENHLVYNGRAPLIPTERKGDVVTEINSYKMTSETKVFLHIARCAPQKNQELLIKAFNRFVESGKDVILLIIGSHFDDTPEGLFLKSIACDNVKFLGTKTNVGDYILCSDAFCLSSVFEGMPITLIECVNSGIPVISTPVCGVIDVIKDKQNGILSKDNEITSYNEALECFLILECSLKNYCQATKKNSQYTIAQCAKGYEAIFGER